jgi:AcrR family transcriptional regulator
LPAVPGDRSSISTTFSSVVTNREAWGTPLTARALAGEGKEREKFSLRQTQKEMTRRRIISSALEIFTEKGFISATLEDIAAAATVSRPTVYAHFGNKGDILRATIDELPEFDPLLSAVCDAEGYDARFIAFRDISDFWHDHLCDVWKLVREAAAVDSQIMCWIESFASAHTQMIRACLEGHGVPVECAHARAFLIWCSWHEYLFWINRSFSKPGRDAMVEALSHNFESALDIGNATLSR